MSEVSDMIDTSSMVETVNVSETVQALTEAHGTEETPTEEETTEAEAPVEEPAPEEEAETVEETQETTQEESPLMKDRPELAPTAAEEPATQTPVVLKTPQKRAPRTIPADYGGMDVGPVNRFVDSMGWSESTRTVSRSILKKFQYLWDSGKGQQGAYEAITAGISYEPFVYSRINAYLKQLGKPNEINRVNKPVREKRPTFVDQV